MIFLVNPRKLVNALLSQRKKSKESNNYVLTSKQESTTAFIKVYCHVEKLALKSNLKIVSRILLKVKQKIKFSSKQFLKQMRSKTINWTHSESMISG